MHNKLASYKVMFDLLTKYVYSLAVKSFLHGWLLFTVIQIVRLDWISFPNLGFGSCFAICAFLQVVFLKKLSNIENDIFIVRLNTSIFGMKPAVTKLPVEKNT